MLVDTLQPFLVDKTRRFHECNHYLYVLAYIALQFSEIERSQGAIGTTQNAHFFSKPELPVFHAQAELFLASKIAFKDKIVSSEKLICDTVKWARLDTNVRIEPTRGETDRLARVSRGTFCRDAWRANQRYIFLF